MVGSWGSSLKTQLPHLPTTSLAPTSDQVGRWGKPNFRPAPTFDHIWMIFLQIKTNFILPPPQESNLLWGLRCKVTILLRWCPEIGWMGLIHSIFACALTQNICVLFFAVFQSFCPSAFSVRMFKHKGYTWNHYKNLSCYLPQPWIMKVTQCYCSTKEANLCNSLWFSIYLRSSFI